MLNIAVGGLLCIGQINFFKYYITCLDSDDEDDDFEEVKDKEGYEEMVKAPSKCKFYLFHFYEL